MSQNLISFQMNDFQSSLNCIEDKFELIYNTVKDTLQELNNAKECLNQSAQFDKNANLNELNEFKQKISDIVYEQCDSMKNSLKELVDIQAECKQFQQKELEIRNKFNENPDGFEERYLKDLINFKINKQKIGVNNKYIQIEEMIENARNGTDLNDEDLVMDEPQNQVIKCPITGKPIVNIAKNSLCNHSYEREAIVEYLRLRPNKKCPYAGCKQQVSIAK